MPFRRTTRSLTARRSRRTSSCRHGNSTGFPRTRSFTAISTSSTRWGQPSVYFPVGDHANVSWCRSYTNASRVVATCHNVASRKTTAKFLSNPTISFSSNPTISLLRKSTTMDLRRKVIKTKLLPSMCYGDPSAIEEPLSYEAITK